MSGETPEERPHPNVTAFMRGYHLAHSRAVVLAGSEAYRAGHALGVADAARAVEVAKERYGPRAEVRPGTSAEGDWFGVYVGDRAIAEGFYRRITAEARAERYNAGLAADEAARLHTDLAAHPGGCGYRERLFYGVSVCTDGKLIRVSIDGEESDTGHACPTCAPS